MDFNHINLNEIDDGFKPIEEGYYNLVVNKLEPTTRTINKPTSEYAGQAVPVLKGSFTIEDHETYSGRKVWHDFWVPFKGAQLSAKKLMAATGVIQQTGQPLADWAVQYATLNPPAKFQAKVTQVLPKEEGGEVRNDIDFFTCKPC